MLEINKRNSYFSHLLPHTGTDTVGEGGGDGMVVGTETEGVEGTTVEELMAGMTGVDLEKDIDAEEANAPRLLFLEYQILWHRTVL